MALIKKSAKPAVRVSPSKKAPAKKVATRKRASAMPASLAAQFSASIPASWLRVMNVMGNALVTTEKQKLTLDAGVAKAVAAPLFPGDAPAAKAFVKLLQKAVKDLDTHASTKATTTPIPLG